MNFYTSVTANPLAHIDRAIAKLEAYRKTVERGGDATSCAMLEELEALKAIDAIWPDWLEGQISERTTELADNYGIGPDGYPLEDTPWNPSRVHPDDPCQSKGYWA
jgi:hypothetical protein